MYQHFKVKPITLLHLKDVLEEYPTAWLHADGNIYVTEADSNFRKDYSNPSDRSAKFRIKFTNISQVPENPEDLNDLFLRTYEKEETAANEKQSRKPDEPKVIRPKHAKVEDPKKEDDDETPADLARAAAYLDERHSDQEARAGHLDAQSEKLAEYEATLNGKEAELTHREKEQANKDSQLSTREQNLREWENKLKEQETKLKKGANKDDKTPQA